MHVVLCPITASSEFFHCILLFLALTLAASSCSINYNFLTLANPVQVLYTNPVQVLYTNPVQVLYTNPVQVLYTRYKFDWDTVEFGNFMFVYGILIALVQADTPSSS